MLKVIPMSGLIPVEDVMASLPKDRRVAIEARSAALLRRVERRRGQSAEADSSAPLRNDKRKATAATE